MMTGDIARMAVRDFGALCALRAEGEAEGRELIMVVRPQSAGNPGRGSRHLPFLNARSMAQDADAGYGLLLAIDAPEGMHEEIRLTVTESSGECWIADAAQPVYDIDPESRKKSVSAWRLALRRRQKVGR